MASKNKNVRSGNEIAILLDGKQIGLIQSISASDDYGPDAASGVGDIHVVEHVPTVARHSVSVSNMLLKTSDMRKAGLTATNGDDVLQGRVYDIAIYDKATGEELRKYRGCTYASGSVEIQKHAILVSSAQFMALDVIGQGL